MPLPAHQLVLVLLGLALAMPAFAELERIRESGVVRIGYRENALPFSYAVGGNAPVGYSIDLCLAIVEDLGKAPGARPLRVEFRPVTAETRLDEIVQGRIDFECGSTTVNPERRARVAFSPVTFVSGTRLLVKRGSALHSMRDLGGRTVVGVAGTTNARALITEMAGRVRDIRVRTARTHAEALAMLDTGAADALAADDVLLAAVLAEPQWRDSYIMVGEPFTQEPYGIAFTRGDAALAAAVNATFVRLATAGELRRVYAKWFLEPLPSGIRLGMPMSSALQHSFQVLGLPRE